MKLNKKFLSCFMAVTMVMAPMSAFAEDTHNITGEGSIEYLNTEIYNLVLPTDESINFSVDPYGVLSSTNSSSLANIVSNAAGTITSSATAVINKSSVGLDVSVGLLFDYADASNSAVKLATDEATAKSGEADLYLTVEQLKDAELTTSSYVASGSATVTVGSAGITNDKDVTVAATTLSPKSLEISGGASSLNIGDVTVVTATDSASYASSNAIEFSLKDVAYAYEVSGKVATLSEDQVQYTPDNVYAFQIGGYANPKSAAWEAISNANGNLALTMKFTISKSEEVEDVEDVEEVEYITSNTMAQGSSTDVEYVLEKSVKSLTYVSVGSTAKNIVLTAGTNYTITSSGMKLNGSWVTKLGAATHTFSVTYTDNTTETITLVVS